MKRERLIVLSLGLAAACGGSAKLPLEAGIGPNPELPAPRRSLIPVVKVAKAEGWSTNEAAGRAGSLRVAARREPSASPVALRTAEWRRAGGRDQCTARAEGEGHSRLVHGALLQEGRRRRPLPEPHHAASRCRRR